MLMLTITLVTSTSIGGFNMEIYVVVRITDSINVEEVVGYFMKKEKATTERRKLQRNETMEKIVRPWDGIKKSLRDFTENEIENGDFPDGYAFYRVKKKELVE